MESFRMAEPALGLTNPDLNQSVMPNTAPTVFEDFVRYGRQSSAYFIFQKNVSCFHGRDGGRVHYGQQKTPLGPVNIVFTNPLCQSDGMKALLEEFLAAQRIPTLFDPVDKEAADSLRELGYSINQIGCESRIILDDFELSGHKKKQLRHASNFGKRHQCEVKELLWQQVDEAQVRNISIQWLRSKGVNNRELQYATRPPVYADEWQVRKFYCMQGERILAYVFFDPYYDNGKLAGYCANILRSIPGKECGGALDFVILEAIKQFRLEGVPELSLGVTPLQNIQKEPGERRSIRLISKLFYEYGNSLYAFKGLAYHKSRYRPIETPWYFCTKDVSLLRAYWGILFGLKVLGGKEI